MYGIHFSCDPEYSGFTKKEMKEAVKSLIDYYNNGGMSENTLEKTIATIVSFQMGSTIECRLVESMHRTDKKILKALQR